MTSLTDVSRPGRRAPINDATTGNDCTTNFMNYADVGVQLAASAHTSQIMYQLARVPDVITACGLHKTGAMQELSTVRPGVQAGVTYGSPTFLVSPDVGTVFDEATLVIDTLNTSELATGSTVGTKADVICAPFTSDVLLWQLICV